LTIPNPQLHKWHTHHDSRNTDMLSMSSLQYSDPTLLCYRGNLITYARVHTAKYRNWDWQQLTWWTKCVSFVGGWMGSALCLLLALTVKMLLWSTVVCRFYIRVKPVSPVGLYDNMLKTLLLKKNIRKLILKYRRTIWNCYALFGII